MGTSDYNNDSMTQPIQDSQEDPIPKKKLKFKDNVLKDNSVFASGHSFGKNPLDRSSGYDKFKQQKQGKREQIAIDEDFLGEGPEDGELSPSMFPK